MAANWNQVGDAIVALSKAVEEIRVKLQQQTDDEPWLQPHWPDASSQLLQQLQQQQQQQQQHLTAPQHKIYAAQTASGYARRLQLYNSLIIVAGLLMTAAYQAMYSAETDMASSAVQAADMAFTFRMFNALSFVTSTLCVLSCLSGMLCLSYFPACTEEPPSTARLLWLASNNQRLSQVGDTIVSKSLYHFAIGSFVASVLTALVACVLGTLSYIGPTAMAWVAFAVAAVMLVLCIWVLTMHCRFQKSGVF
jgi:hypothetical protein